MVPPTISGVAEERGRERKATGEGGVGASLYGPIVTGVWATLLVIIAELLVAAGRMWCVYVRGTR